MEKQPSFVPKLSLKDIALKRVAIIVWIDPGILASIVEVHFKSRSYCRSEYSRKLNFTFERTVVKKVKDKVSKLLLPESIKKELMNIVKPIGLQIHNWKRFHEEYLSNSLEDLETPIFDNLFWTSLGIDYRKTAEEIIRCKMLDDVKLYKLACLYCIEDYIPAFWQDLPEETKISFYNTDASSHLDPLHLYFCWPFILEGEISKLDEKYRIGSTTSFHQYAFEYSSLAGNKAGAEYFFRKLTYEERDASLVRTASRVLEYRHTKINRNHDNFPMKKHSEVFFYLLSLMTPEQQMVIFRELTSSFLSVFMEWPWQDRFLEIASLVWIFLPEDHYGYLITKMRKVLRSSDYYFPELFQEFFIKSPAAFRKCFVNFECEFTCFFRKFFELQDVGSIEVILSNIDGGDKVKLLTSKKCSIAFDRLKLRYKWLYSSDDTIQGSQGE